jgi:hypothetical protein
MDSLSRRLERSVTREREGEREGRLAHPVTLSRLETVAAWRLDQ